MLREPGTAACALLTFVLQPEASCRHADVREEVQIQLVGRTVQQRWNSCACAGKNEAATVSTGTNRAVTVSTGTNKVVKVTIGTNIRTGKNSVQTDLPVQINYSRYSLNCSLNVF